MNITCCVACHYTCEVYCKNKKLKEALHQPSMGTSLQGFVNFSDTELNIYIFLNLHIKLKLRETFAILLLHMELSVQDK